MRKSMMIAGALACSCALALPAAADTGLVDIELTFDHSQSAEAIYEQVLDKASDICETDTFCENDLVNALVDAIDSEAVDAVHAARVDQPFQIASSE